MSETNHNGPWRVEQSEEWPFRIHIYGADGEYIAGFDRIAHASKQRTVSDCMQAAGFARDERDKIVGMLERQMRRITLQASAPALYEALFELVVDYKNASNYWTSEDAERAQPILEKARAALAQSQGWQP